MVNKIYDVMNTIYYMMKLNLLWIGFTLLGGVVLGFVPATIALFGCVRNKIRNKNESAVLPQFKQFYRDNFKRSLVISGVFVALVLVVLSETAALSAVHDDLALEITIKVTRVLIALFGVMFFPVFVHFDLHGSRMFLQPLFMMFICPVEVLLMIVMFLAIGIVYFINPFLIIFVGLALPAYGVMGLMLHRFNKMQANIPFIHEVGD